MNDDSYKDLLEPEDVSNKEIFVIGVYLDNDIKIELLEKQINLVKRACDIPIMLVSHYPIPDKIQESVDIVLYTKDSTSEKAYDFLYNYWFETSSIKIVTKITYKPYHATSILSSIKNALNFCDGRYGIIHYFEFDMFFYINKYLDKVREVINNGKKFVGFKFDEQEGLFTGIMSFDVSWMNNHIVKIYDWEDYRRMDNFLRVINKDETDLFFEKWLYRFFKGFNMLKDTFLIEDRSPFMIMDNVIDTTVKEKIFLSETKDGKLIIFVVREEDKREDLQKIFKVVDRNSQKVIAYGNLITSVLFWYIIDKEETVLDFYVDDKIVDSIFIDKNYLYNDVVFKFEDDSIECVSWYGMPGWGVKDFEEKYRDRKIERH